MLAKELTVKGIDILCLALAGIAVSLAMSHFFDSRRVTAALVSGEDMREVIVLARAQQQALLDQAHVALVLISKTTIGEEEDCSTKLTELLVGQKNLLSLGIADANGDVVCSSLPGRRNISDRMYFTRAVESGKFSVGEYQVHRVLGKPSIVFAYPFKDENGVVTRVSAAAVDLAWLHDVVRAAKLPPGAELSIVDDKGIVLARYSDNAVGVVAEELKLEMESVVRAENELAIIKVKEQDGGVRYMAVAPVGVPGQEGLLHVLLSVPGEYVGRFGLGNVLNAF